MQERSMPPPNRRSVDVPPGEVPRDVRVAFAAGSVDALTEIFGRYRRPVWTVVAKTLNGSAVVDDAVQEVFLRAWRSADRYDPDRSLGPWLFTIARRTAIDVLRREMRPTRGDHEVEGDLPSVDFDEDGLWQAWEVRRAIDRLPDDEAEVVRLAHLHGFTHVQIAEAVGVPVGTIKSRSYRAHRRLAVWLAHLAPGT